MNKIFNEDCGKTLVNKDINFDYVFTVPPDFDELDMTPKEDTEKYINFLYSTLQQLQNKCEVITVAITDRKFDSGIVSKHTWITNIMTQGFVFKLISHKIWQKSKLLNLYRLNYAHILTFARGKIKQNHPKDYEYDIYTDEDDKYKGFSYSIPVSIVCKLISNFTQEGDIVFDPFMGSGSTAIAALRTKRNYLGSEINEEYCNMANKRIVEFKSQQHKWF